MLKRFQHGGWALQIWKLRIVRCDDKHPYRWMVTWG